MCREINEFFIIKIQRSLGCALFCCKTLNRWSTQEVRNDTRIFHLFPPTGLDNSPRTEPNRFLRPLQQSRAQLRLLYLLIINCLPYTLCFWHFKIFCPMVGLIYNVVSSCNIRKTKEQGFAFVMRANIKLWIMFLKSSCEVLDLNLWSKAKTLTNPRDCAVRTWKSSLSNVTHFDYVNLNMQWFYLWIVTVCYEYLNGNFMGTFKLFNSSWIYV